ncbi:ATP-grasp domain-containing protein [Streptomyces vietnamensis]|uniref:ATP-grasp domain-containing protein n=1 Tax=Streptomyces vietnamensis TaxID=362257 RepID=UPI00099B32F3|nr:ATP-grasp domain-containing protein [Streptomyces vietnamensis]
MPSVLFVNTRRSPLEVNATALAAHRLGYDVVVLADREPPFASELVAETHVVDTFDTTAAREAALALARRHAVHGVVTWGDRDVEFVSALTTELGLPGLPPAAARTVRNKFLTREALGAAGRPDLMPAYARVHDESSLRSAADRVGYPAILKPTSASGSRGIHRIDSARDLAGEYELLRAFTRPERDPIFRARPGELIYEELLGGTEHSIEGLVVGDEVWIVGITDKWVAPEYSIEYLQVHPTGLEPARQRALEELTTETVRATGMRDCVFHLECRLLPDGTARLLEVAGRIGGGYITSHLIPLATGIDFYAATIAVATGNAPDLTPRTAFSAGSRQLISPRAGTFAGFNGLNAVLELPGVEHVALDQAVGTRVALPPQDYMSCVLGSVIARRGSHTAVREVLEQAARAADPGFTQPAEPATAGHGN